MLSARQFIGGLPAAITMTRPWVAQKAVETGPNAID
jgi:hypothetical protein